MGDPYREFLEAKRQRGADDGFRPLWMPGFLFDFQSLLVEWALRKGRAAIFADCGLGKTPMQLVWAQNVIQKENKPVLIITPLAVGLQTLHEAEKFGIEAKRSQNGTAYPCITAILSGSMSRLAFAISPGTASERTARRAESNDGKKLGAQNHRGRFQPV